MYTDHPFKVQDTASCQDGGHAGVTNASKRPALHTLVPSPSHTLVHVWPHACASQRVSRGFSIKQLKFNKQGELTLSRVNRQMTQDEQEQLVNPGVR